MLTLLAATDACFIGWNRKPIYRFGVCPNKLFDYMMAARPVIQPAIVRPAGLVVTDRTASRTAVASSPKTDARTTVVGVAGRTLSGAGSVAGGAISSAGLTVCIVSPSP